MVLIALDDCLNTSHHLATWTRMHLTSLLALSLAALAARACPGEEHGDSHAHVHERRAYPQTHLTPPSRALDWSDVNVIHTTDSHGWLLGHQKTSFPEPNYR